MIGKPKEKVRENRSSKKRQTLSDRTVMSDIHTNRRTKYSAEVASRLKRDATVVEKVKEEVCLKMCMVGRSVKIYYKNVQYTHIRGVP